MYRRGAAVESVGQRVRLSVCSESSSFPQPQHLWTVLKETSAIVKQMMIVKKISNLVTDTSYNHLEKLPLWRRLDLCNLHKQFQNSYPLAKLS